jgi:CRISPR-associated protein Cas2
MSQRYELLVCYDVETISVGGQRRLRQMAKACSAYGQRVQYSVFELNVTRESYERFRKRATEIIDPQRDSLRIYFLNGDREQYLKVFGRDGWIDFESPLIV